MIKYTGVDFSAWQNERAVSFCKCFALNLLPFRGLEELLWGVAEDRKYWINVPLDERNRRLTAELNCYVKRFKWDFEPQKLICSRDLLSKGNTQNNYWIFTFERHPVSFHVLVKQLHKMSFLSHLSMSAVG